MKNKDGNEGVLMHLSPDNLLTHPKNLRRFYPDDQVREMADSIRAVGGVYQAMRIVRNGTEGRYFVVDGNMRLAGARLLGRECPQLKCELVSDSAAEQFLAMLITAKARYKPDPVSEALHYKRLIDEEHYSVRKIARASGIHETIIRNRLTLLELDPEIQELMAHGSLSTDPRVVKALLAIPHKKARIKLAQRLAADIAGIKAILSSCERLTAKLQEVPQAKSGGAPSMDLGKQKAFGKTVPPEKPAKWQEIRKAAKAMCEQCDIKSSQLAGVQEPAWSIISHAAQETCERCNLREIRSCCNECPSVDLIHRLIMTIGERKS